MLLPFAVAVKCVVLPNAVGLLLTAFKFVIAASVMVTGVVSYHRVDGLARRDERRCATRPTRHSHATQLCRRRRFAPSPKFHA
jgi:hypothetical protein